MVMVLGGAKMILEHYSGPKNRTMDLSLLEKYGSDFLDTVENMKTKFFRADATWQVDGVDNPYRRYWEYWWMIEHGLILNPFAKILDAGCGFAIFQFLLLEIYANIRVVGVDSGKFCPDFLYRVADISHKLGYKGRYGATFNDLCSLEFPDRTFDNVFCVSVIEHITEDEQVIQELLRVLKRGGTLGLTFDFHKDSFPDRKDRLYMIKDINRILDAASRMDGHLMYNDFVDLTDWNNPPVNLSDKLDHKYNFGALFISRR